MNWCSVFLPKKGRISLSPLATQPHCFGTLSRHVFPPLQRAETVPHFQPLGKGKTAYTLINRVILTRKIGQRKPKNRRSSRFLLPAPFPLLRTQRSRQRRHKEEDAAEGRHARLTAVTAQRELPTAEPTPYVVRRTSCCAVAAFDEENPVFRWKYGFPSF